MELLFFHGRYCPPCGAAEKKAKKLAKAHGIPLYTFDVTDVYGGHTLAKNHRVTGVPCLILLGDSGAEVARAGQDLAAITDALDTLAKGGED